MNDKAAKAQAYHMEPTILVMSTTSRPLKPTCSSATRAA